MTDTDTAFTEDQITAALNRACDDIAAAADLPDWTVDALNLLVNAAIGYLTGRCETLQEVARRSYSEDLDVIVSWVGTA